MSHSYDNAIQADGQQSGGRYRALSAAAMTSLILGTLSAVVFLDWNLALLPVAAIVAGWWALRRIARAPQEMTGSVYARLGMVLAVVFWIGGYGWLLLAKVAEVPYGYRAVRYDQLQPDRNDPDQAIPQTALDLKDKRIFLKGYISDTRYKVRLKRFILCPTNGVCQFCIPNPTRTEMIRVTLSGDLATDYTTRLIGVGGRFHIDEKNVQVPYAMEVDYLK